MLWSYTCAGDYHDACITHLSISLLLYDIGLNQYFKILYACLDFSRNNNMYKFCNYYDIFYVLRNIVLKSRQSVMYLRIGVFRYLRKLCIISFCFVTPAHHRRGIRHVIINWHWIKSIASVTLTSGVRDRWRIACHEHNPVFTFVFAFCKHHFRLQPVSLSCRWPLVECAVR